MFFQWLCTSIHMLNGESFPLARLSTTHVRVLHAFEDSRNAPVFTGRVIAVIWGRVEHVVAPLLQISCNAGVSQFAGPGLCSMRTHRIPTDSGPYPWDLEAAVRRRNRSKTSAQSSCGLCTRQCSTSRRLLVREVLLQFRQSVAQRNDGLRKVASAIALGSSSLGNSRFSRVASHGAHGPHRRPRG